MLESRCRLVRDVQSLKVRGPVRRLWGVCELWRRRCELRREMLEVRLRWAWTALLEGIELRLKSTIWTWRRSEALKAMSS